MQPFTVNGSAGMNSPDKTVKLTGLILNFDLYTREYIT
jgi:hypothetical protein